MSDSEGEPQVVLNTEEREEAEREENNQIYACFFQYDYNKEGIMNTTDLKGALENLGEKVSDTQVYRMIADVDPNNTGTLNFYSFKDIVSAKREDERETSDADLLDAYVAMGGDQDGGGCVDADVLIRTIKQEFEMTIDIEALIAEVDEDGSGEIEFDEFKELLAGGGGGDDDDDADDGEVEAGGD